MASPSIQLSELDTLHAFVSPIFFVQNEAGKKTKWNELIERLLALYALLPDGNFSDAKRMTQPFETIIYHYCYEMDLYYYLFFILSLDLI